MTPIDPPRLHGSPLGSAQFKSHPDDFQVDEVLGWTPSGEGEHCFLWIQKRGCNSNDVAAQIAKRLEIRKRLISHCGLKDKNAITRQWFSIHLPGIPSPTAEKLQSENFQALKITRNSRKLRRGVHRGNRFAIRLTDCQFTPADLESRWSQIVSRGVPNYFGPQRFGHGGGNIEQALKMASGESKVHDRLLRGILISSLRSFLFNACVGERILAGNWDQPLPGEVYGFADNRSLIFPHNQNGDEPERFRNGQLELSAPLWGLGDLPSENAVAELESSVVGREPEIRDAVEQFGLQQQRRVIRIKPSHPELQWETPTTLCLRFELPKGAYATAIIRELIAI